MIVESLGTSGSGKSSMIPILTRTLIDGGFKAMAAKDAIIFHMRKTWVGIPIGRLLPPSLQTRALWRAYSYTFGTWYSIKFIFKHLRMVGYVLRSQLKRQIPWSHRMLILGLYFELAGKVEYLRRHVQASDVVFLDEGFVHRATHLFVSENETIDARSILGYMTLVPAPDLLLWIRSPLELCLDRIYKRGLQVRLTGVDSEAAKRFLSNAEAVCEISAEYGKKAGWQIIEVDNNGDQESIGVGLGKDIAARLTMPVEKEKLESGALMCA